MGVSRVPIKAGQSPEQDSGWRCPACDYNLTGLDEPICPECGSAIDWLRALRAAQRAGERLGPCWQRWRWYAKPAAFVVTALQTALLPWQLARQVPLQPSPAWPALFLALCIVPVCGERLWHADSLRDCVPWIVGVLTCIALQTLLFGLLLRPVAERPAFGFWSAVSCYTSYPLLAEWYTDPPILLAGMSNIWPFHWILGDPWGDRASWQTHALYYLWWAGLIVVAWVSLPRRNRRRALLLLALVPLISCAACYAGYVSHEEILPSVWSSIRSWWH